MDNTLQKEIIIMQNHLKELRKLAGWTSEELGKKLGVTKQAVSAMENGSSKMSQLHYLALVHLFESEIANNPENTTLSNVMSLLFSNPDYYETKKNQIDDGISNIAAAIAGGVTVAAVGILASSLLPKVVDKKTQKKITQWSDKILSLGKK